MIHYHWKFWGCLTQAFETEFHVSQAGLSFAMWLTMTLNFWAPRWKMCVTPPFLKSVLGIKPRALDWLSKHSTNSVTSQSWIPFRKKNFVSTVSELQREASEEEEEEGEKMKEAVTESDLPHGSL